MTATNTHLDKHATINLGSFYTPNVLVANPNKDANLNEFTKFYLRKNENNATYK